MDGLAAFGVDLGPVQVMKDILPLSSMGLQWILPALVGTAVGMALSSLSRTHSALDEVEVKAS